MLARVLDAVVAAGADDTMLDVSIDRTNEDTSRAHLLVTAPDETTMGALLEELQQHGANRTAHLDAALVACEVDGALPAGFHSTTNLPTQVRVGGCWRDVVGPETACALVVTDGTVRRACRDRHARTLAVLGPAVIHTGAGPDVASLVREGWIDVLFAGNGFATHDMESNVLGTSLGISVDSGTTTEGGHSNHLRVINEVRRFGSIASAVEGGYVRGGVMYECVRREIPFVLAGSVRDDGPLPDVRIDVVAAVDEMRRNVAGVGVALMFASTLHAIATGNILPAGVETYCVDINQAVVTELADRGSHQALGIVTDVRLFVGDLTDASEGDGAGPRPSHGLDGAAQVVAAASLASRLAAAALDPGRAQRRRRARLARLVADPAAMAVVLARPTRCCGSAARSGCRPLRLGGGRGDGAWWWWRRRLHASRPPGAAGRCAGRPAPAEGGDVARAATGAGRDGRPRDPCGGGRLRRARTPLRRSEDAPQRERAGRGDPRRGGGRASLEKVRSYLARPDVDDVSVKLSGVSSRLNPSPSTTPCATSRLASNRSTPTQPPPRR